jgi:hypothetical protein
MFSLPPAGELYSGQEKCRGTQPEKKDFRYGQRVTEMIYDIRHLSNGVKNDWRRLLKIILF